MLDTWRVKALQKMVKAYKPHLEIDFILSELVFTTPSSSQSPSSSSLQVSEGIDFIVRVGGVITTTTSTTSPSTTTSLEGEQILDTKLSSISSSSVIAQDDQLLL